MKKVPEHKLIDLKKAISGENNKPTSLYLTIREDRFTEVQVTELRDTGEELYIAASELSEEKHISGTSITGGEEVFSSQELHR